MEEFVDAITTGRPPANSGTDALRMVTLISAALESHRTGRHVELATFDATTVRIPGVDEEAR
jgi:predicted dehydrogenase